MFGCDNALSQKVAYPGRRAAAAPALPKLSRKRETEIPLRDAMPLPDIGLHRLTPVLDGPHPEIDGRKSAPAEKRENGFEHCLLPVMSIAHDASAALAWARSNVANSAQEIGCECPRPWNGELKTANG
jgi:hypothetical protein